MSLSRHFYALDEVHAALQYSSTRNDRRETVFWCHELLRSGCASEAISTLFESWLWNNGAFGLAWLTVAEQLASDEVAEEDILLGAYQLSWIPFERRDHSVWHVLALSSQGVMPDRVTPKTPPYLPFEDANEVFMVRAMFQGKAYSAWWISRHLEDTRVWELLRWYVRYICPCYAERYMRLFDILENYPSLLGYSSGEYDVIVRCVAVLSACLSFEQQEKSWNPLPSMEMGVIEEWDNEIGRMVHRRYRIPSACLYGRCQRGRMKWSESTIGCLGDIEKGFIGCPFWEAALEEYQTDGVWRSNDAREAFYDRYLDVIPDEWTKEEKQKSHGDGVLGPNETIQLSKWARPFHTARLAWNASLVYNMGESDPLSISRCASSVISEEMLRPIHRKPIS
jgi:hypothetical protein